MARIPIEKESGGGFPWLPLLLGLLLLIGLGYLVFELIDDDEPEMVETVDTYQDDYAVTDPVTTGAITSLATLINPNDASALVGRDVRIDGLRARAISGDSTFYVMGDNDTPVLVVLRGLGEEERGARGSDGMYNVDAGDRINIVSGKVMKFNMDMLPMMQLKPEDRQMAERAELYIAATSLEKGDAAM